MDVTLSNFNEVLPEVLKAIDDSDFIAIDTEFTGLRNGPDATAYDTPDIYYSKIKNGSLHFLLVQLGLSMFKYDRKLKKYIYKAFNFFVFPRTFGRSGNDVNFLCQSSSVHFLCSNGFDFNKLFSEGIPYLNIADTENLQAELVTKYENLNKSESSFSKIQIPDEFVTTIEDACSRIEKFLSPGNEANEIVFDGCNNFMRRLIYQTAYERFPSKNFNLSSKWIDGNMIFVAQKGKSKAEIDKENFEKEKKEISDASGFSRIIKYISDSKKLIVGHNMLLDILHIVNRFCWPLPDSYSEFKEMVHALFPRIIDTKYMCSAYPFRDLIQSSVMDHMLKRLHEPPFEFKEAEPENTDFGYSTGSSKAHEAGFDAYMTGMAFIALTSYLGKKGQSNFDLGKKSGQSNLPTSFETLKPFENRLFIMRIIDYFYINLKGEEPLPNRSHVFHISFPGNWKTNDIEQLFRPYGEIFIRYCNQTSAWVTLRELVKADAVIADLVETNLKEVPALRKPYTVITLSQYYEQKQKSSPTTTTSSLISPYRTSSNSLAPSPSISRCAGDAKLTDVEIELPTKHSSIATESIPKKKKKSNKHLNTEDVIIDDDMKFKLVECTSNSNKTQDGNKSEEYIQKTFEEPVWE